MTDAQQLILQDGLFVKPWEKLNTLRLPGVNPLKWEDWLLQDEAFAAQMAYRDQLIEECRPIVFDALDNALPASEELLGLVMLHLKTREGYSINGTSVTRPDGITIDTAADHPLIVAGRLVQQDFCLLYNDGSEHVLNGAILCFPSNWRLSEKIGHPMTAIHGPVRRYDKSVAKRVQRIFDHISPENPVWRANYLLYSTANLYQPNREVPASVETGRFVRVERQSLVRLPKTDHVVFGIHSHVVPIETLSDAERTAFFDAWKASHHADVNAQASDPSET